MSHPIPTRRPIPATALVAMFFLATVSLGVLTNAAPLVALLVAILIAIALTAAFLRGWSIR